MRLLFTILGLMVVVGLLAFTGSKADNHIPEGGIVTADDVFSIGYDCKLRSATGYYYSLGGKYPRIDKTGPSYNRSVNRHCQAKTLSPFDGNYERTYLLEPSIVGHYHKPLSLSLTVLNTVPMYKDLKHGSWAMLRDLEDCWRHKGDVKVVAGLVFNDSSNDYYLETHGVPTPDAIWKYVTLPNGNSHFFVFDNSEDHIQSPDLSDYLQSTDYGNYHLDKMGLAGDFLLPEANQSPLAYPDEHCGP